MWAYEPQAPPPPGYMHVLEMCPKICGIADVVAASLRVQVVTTLQIRPRWCVRDILDAAEWSAQERVQRVVCPPVPLSPAS